MVKISDKIIKIVGDHLGVKSSEISLNSSINGDLKGDSLDFAEILAVVEEEFGINIPDEYSEKIDLLSDMSSVVCYYVLIKNLEENDSNSDENKNLLESLRGISPLEFSKDLDFISEFENNTNSKEIKKILEQL